MGFEPENASFCLVLGKEAWNSSLSEISKCWDCEEQLGFSDPLLANLSINTNCSECLENVCSDFVAEQNWSRSRAMVPVAAFMGVLMLLGIPGNLIVLVVYFFKQKKTTANKFMMALSSIDLHACLVVHPYIISKMFTFYSPSTWVCKTFEYLLYITQSTQGITLLAVAVDRYYAVYKPLAFGYAENAAYIIPSCIVTAAAMGIPMILFYGKKTVWLYDEQSEVHIKTHVCHYSDEYDGSRDHLIYMLITLIMLVIIVMVISILYILIAVKIMKRNAQVGPLGTVVVPIEAGMKRETVADIHSKPSLDTSSSTVGCQKHEGEGTETDGRVRNSTTMSQQMHRPTDRPEELDLITALDIQPVAHCSSFDPPIHNTLSTVTVLPLANSLNVPLSLPGPHLRMHSNAAVHPAKKSTGSSKGYKLLFIVTAVFFLSWLPFWVLRFLYESGEWWLDRRVFSTLLSHLFFLNNAVNPILYVFINKKFLEECRMTKKKIYTRLRYMCC